LKSIKNILITGSDGFIAKNLIQHLREDKYRLILFSKRHSKKQLKNMIKEADFIFHLAGENRPKNPKAFIDNNINLTKLICDISENHNPVPICFSSSTQATLSNDYGKSKKLSEEILLKYQESTGQNIYIFRLPGVFGKWSKPNYNSVVSTFCYKIANDQPIEIHDKNTKIELVYIDDLIINFLRLLKNATKRTYIPINKIYKISLGTLANKINSFRKLRNKFFIDKVGSGITRALYSTYLSYLPTSEFCYDNEMHEDARGVFSEIIKTKNSGQISFFTAKPKVTRGIHYHHTKTEKFTVIQGEAKLKFKNILSGEKKEIIVSSDRIQTIDTIPGWAHDITNIGKEDLVVLLWANEVFDPEHPDTYHFKT
jgi:UDP-2-acetamido-2,6-beta-L-arabino-hexul-4-ose reductase